MATFDDVAAIIAELPETRQGERRGNLTWYVRDKAFAWERPFTKADLRRFAEETPAVDPPAGQLLAVRVADQAEKEAVLAAGTPGVFTISHFEGFDAVLVQLDAVPGRALQELVTDAWLARAPDKLTKAWLTQRG